MASSVISSRDSELLVRAFSPPAIIPCINSGEEQNVGGHSEASRTPNLPDVPVPI